MQPHELKPHHEDKATRRVGRGGKRGKTSGRGGKGQTARAGNKRRPEFRDLLKKLPKRRGYGRNRARTVNNERVRPVTLALSALSPFSAGDTVSPKILLERGIITTRLGKVPMVKLLAEGEVKHALTIVGCTVSATAKEKILAAGGTVA